MNILNPATRVASTSGTTVNINGTLTVTLNYKDANKQNQSLTQTVDLSTAGADASRKQTIRFWNIPEPVSVTASINGGINDYTNKNITLNDVNDGGNLQALPASIPAYGETSDFALTGTMQPENSDNKVENESGYKTGDDQKTFQQWSASIQMAIPVARLEVGHIYHETHTDPDKCEFKNLKIAGVYLDKLSDKGTVYSSTTNEGVTTYSYKLADGASTIDNVDFFNATLKDGPAKDAVDHSAALTSSSNFSTYFPAENEVYAFNFFAGNNPQFKIYFASADYADGEDGQNREAWAMITKFKETDDMSLLIQKRNKKAPISKNSEFRNNYKNYQYDYEEDFYEPRY